MKLAIQTSGIPMDVDVIGHIERRAEFALSRLGLYVQQIKVSLIDLNGPRGGVDKRCQLQVQLADETPVIVTETSADTYAAINRAFSVASRLASHRIARRVMRARRSDVIRREFPQIVS
ncbi:hypothetical protein Q9Q94_12430 [Uliginosibacterium sp. 31-16]|uniref:hypothetical protein n=1 Tax=Uliginosibacterium sp. 31-16 TaxID=3068315 RepID=UPI00273EB770|nr:hypothetical protein [Uliginosibacterium sp. 31-16]MDP5240341.1 hypothetical protein [Uliginosibacterium sp. 31-16]